jgi:hypothetical protein
LSVHPFEKVPLPELFMKTDCNTLSDANSNQLSLWDL